MTSECYVTIHDQDLIALCEARGQFAAFPSRTYLFVGPRPIDRVPAGVKVIVARDLEPNVEHLPQFYDFTGWWALARHGLIEADQVICMQYDMWVTAPNIEAVCRTKLTAAPGMVAFNAGHRGPNWMLRIPGFAERYEEAMRHHGLTLEQVAPAHEWPSTQGTAWTTETFVEFMAWFEPLFDVFKGHVFAGHLAERTVRAFLVQSGWAQHYGLGLISHDSADLHGTGALMAGQVDVYERRNAEFMYQSS